jgi:hypothetical protein
MPKKSISQLILDYFQAHPNQDLKHGPVVDWVENEYIKQGGTKPRDTWRAIRKLYEEGQLIQVKKGVYRYDPSYVHKIELFDFPPEVKEAIFKRDNYKCVVCGRGRKDGVEICADHIKPKNKGGDNTIENGQTLCTEHNLIKKNLSQTEAGKKFIIKMYENAVTAGDQKMIRFCMELFDVYDKEGINSHIPRPNHK